MYREKNKLFRKMLNSPGMIIAPGVHDAMGARVVQASGCVDISLICDSDSGYGGVLSPDAKRAHDSPDGAIRRGRKFANAGADAVFFKQLENKDEIAQITRSVTNAPV